MAALIPTKTCKCTRASTQFCAIVWIFTGIISIALFWKKEHMMRLNLTWLREPYRPGAGPVVQDWIRPDRHALLALRRYWPWLRLATTSVLIILVTLPMQFRLDSVLVALFAAGCYLVAMAGFELAERRINSLTWRQHLGGVRKLAGLLALMAVHWFLPAASTELWLLYLIPMMTLGVDLDRVWATCLIVLTMILMFLSAWPFSEGIATLADWWFYFRSGLFRAIVSGYVGLTSYLLSRCLAYQTNTTRKMLSRLFDATAADRWLNMPNTIARIIADLLSGPTNRVVAHVLIYEPTREKMKLIGSSAAAGQEMAQEGFRFDAERGITGWAARRQEPCFINDTANDPEQRFLRDKAFPHTRSALAVPIPLDHQQCAVLEIESSIPYDVAYEDLQLMNHVAHYLLATHQRHEILEFQERLAKLGAELADRIIHVEEIGSMLEEIGQVALDLLDADIIRFYYRNPETNRIEERRTVGKLRVPDGEESPVSDRESVVYQLMDESRLQKFTNALKDQRLTRKLRWHRQQNREPFVIREAIHSCVAMPLILGKEKLGLMWVNYRRPQEFTSALCASIQMLAPYAALAIKSGVQSALADRQRREKLRRDLHDSLSARLRNAGFAMDRLERQTPNTDEWREMLFSARLSVSCAITVISLLQGERLSPTLRSFLDDLRTLADLGGHIYGVPIRFTASDIPDIPVSDPGSTELLFACEEAIQNALRHAGATCIEIRCEYIAPAMMQICIGDNGVGFDSSQLTRVDGIENMRARIEDSLGGWFNLNTQPGHGTQITVRIPLIQAKEAIRDHTIETTASVAC
jgi:signal transduction histidine kinase